ncbi:transcription antitermination factor NusB [Planctomicrobium sp. SH661]|uniref:transcription antitermination factor NusB n=1 Tax=Planctomicrobium sp. SH661 TaxID=3448124 RepID=UPI003F5BF59A
MSKRSKARQIAVQMLFQVDLNPDVTGRMVREMICERLNEPNIQEFAWGLFAGCMEHRPALDERIQQVAENWKLSRMAGTDRAVLRLGAFELLHTSTPVGVVIDEAVELAKKFGARQSSQFVNGILDRLVPAERRRSKSTEAALPAEAPETDAADEKDDLSDDFE